jgi:hypothetical protein
MEQHYILIPSQYHSNKILKLIYENQIQIGKSYPINTTPTIIDPITFKPHTRFIIILNKKSILIEKEELEQSFSTLQNWRNLQISKLTGEIPNEPLIEYINYLQENLTIIKKELIENPLKDSDIIEETEIIGKQIIQIKDKLNLNTFNEVE